MVNLFLIYCILTLDMKGGPGVIELTGMKASGARVLSEDGTLAGRIVSRWPRIALPPGKYVVEMSGQRLPTEIAEGAKVVLRPNQDVR